MTQESYTIKTLKDLIKKVNSMSQSDVESFRSRSEMTKNKFLKRIKKEKLCLDQNYLIN